jgi:hypothetical protein
MTDNKPEDYEIDVNHIETMFADELDGLDVEIREREIGNGPQYAVETYREGTATQITESLWYTREEFEAFCEGMKHLGTMFRKAERERSEE